MQFIGSGERLQYDFISPFYFFFILFYPIPKSEMGFCYRL